jgi:hypothetical protein
MALRIEEYDFGTKKGAIRAATRLQRHAPQRFPRAVWKYWYKVYQFALQEVPVDTGALRRSIRIVRGKENVTGEYVRGVSLKGVEVNHMIVAGGGVINPRHGKEVDYAQAVHDGYYSGGRRRTRLPRSAGLTKTGRRRTRMIAMGRWVPGNPFLTRAIRKAEPYFKQVMREYMDEKEKLWIEGQTMPNIFSLPTRMMR